MNVSNVIGCALRIAKFGVRPKREERVKKKRQSNFLQFTPYFAREMIYFRMVRISTASKASDCNASYSTKSKQIVNREREKKKTRKNEKENGSSDSNSNDNGVKVIEEEEEVSK